MLLTFLSSTLLVSSLPLLSSAGRSHPARFVPGHSSHLASRSSSSLQTFGGALGGFAAPAVTMDSALLRPYVVGKRQELDLQTALGISCDEQHNLCADAANAGGDWTVGECDKQNEECKGSISSDSTPVPISSQAVTSASVQTVAASAIATSVTVAVASSALASASSVSSFVEAVPTSSVIDAIPTTALPVDTASSIAAPALSSSVKPITSSVAIVAPSVVPVKNTSASSAIVSPSVVQEVAIPSSVAVSPSPAVASTRTRRVSASKASTAAVAVPTTKAPVPSKAVTPPSTSAFKSSYAGLKKGDGTFYGDSSAGNACLLPERSDMMFAAWPGATWNTAAPCGSCLKVTGPLGSVNVQVINECPECLEGSIDLSTTAFTKIATKSDGRVPISWEIISCFDAGLEKPETESFVWKSGSSAYWAGIQARHTEGNVASLAVKLNGVYTDIPKKNFNYYVQESGLGSGPFDVKVTLDNGDVFERSSVALNSVIGDA